METSLEEVTKHCSRQLQSYQTCVTQNGSEWETKCRVQKRELSKCAEENVGILKAVKQKCSKIISSYETCVKNNQSQPERCMDQLRELYKCTNTAAAELQKK